MSLKLKWRRMTPSLSLFEGYEVELWLCCPPQMSFDCPTWFPLSLACAIPQNDFSWSFVFEQVDAKEGMLRRTKPYVFEGNQSIQLPNC